MTNVTERKHRISAGEHQKLAVADEQEDIRYKLAFDHTWMFSSKLSCAIVRHEVCQEYVRQTCPKENVESVQVNARNLPLPLNRKTDPL